MFARKVAGDPIIVRWFLQEIADTTHYALVPGIERALGADPPCDMRDANRPYRSYLPSITHHSDDTYQHQALIAHLNDLLEPVFDCEDALDRVAHRIVPYLADWCMINLVDANAQVYPAALAHQRPEMEDRLLEQIESDPSDAYLLRLVMDTFQSGQSLIVSDISPHALRQYSAKPGYCDLLAELGTRSVMVVPLWGREQVIGVVTLVSALPGYFSMGDRGLAEDLAHRIGHAVEHAGGSFCPGI